MKIGNGLAHQPLYLFYDLYIILYTMSYMLFSLKDIGLGTSYIIIKPREKAFFCHASIVFYKHKMKSHNQSTNSTYISKRQSFRQLVLSFIAFLTHYFDIINHNNFIDQPMNRFRPYLNRFVKQKELDITDIYHDLNMKQIRPITTKLMQHSQTYTINNSKKEMIREVRDFQIERENKMLLGKIQSVMAKRGSYSVAKTKSINTKLNKSLNDIYRKKQLQSIQLENKRFLLRLQSKKPTVNTMKLRKDWQDNKSVIKRMANHQFNLTHFKTKDSRMRSLTSQRMFRQKYQDIKISKFKVIDGHKMLIKIEFADGFLKIVGDSRDHKDLKVIDIPKDEAVIFLEKDCDGKAERLLDKLRYDEKTETLYLVSETIEETNDFGDLNPQGAKIKIKNRTNSVHENRQKRQSKSTLEYITSVNQPNEREDLYMNHTISHKMNDRARLSSKELIKPSTHEIINFEQSEEIMPDAKMEKQQENEVNNSQAIENLFQ